jgi:imidazoleglycerol phosphate synthase glutamine amidotransferase subunit HisH
MIAIISFCKHNAEQIKSLLNYNELEIKISSLETDIVKADKIILPDAINFNSAYRKLQFSNLFSLIRLLNKPILGINIGFHLMCKSIVNKNKTGLGLFDVDISGYHTLSEDKKYRSGTVKLIGKSKLVKKIDEGTLIEAYKQNYQSINKFTKSILLIDNEEYSLTYENDNYFGVELNFEKNQLFGKHLIENFISV